MIICKEYDKIKDDDNDNLQRDLAAQTLRNSQAIDFQFSLPFRNAT